MGIHIGLGLNSPRAGASVPPIITAPAQFAPGDWSVTTGLAASQIVLNVTALPANGGSAITALEYSTNGGTSWTALSGTGTGSRTLTMGAAGTSYTFVLRAVNAIGNGPASASKSATSGAGAGGSAVVGNSATIPTQEADLSFTLSAACDYGYNATGGIFVVTPPGGLTITSRTPAQGLIDGVLSNGTVKNPQVSNNEQGWDARIANYSAPLTAAFPLTVARGDIVVMAISGPTPTGGTQPNRKGYITKYVPIFFVETAWNVNAHGPAIIGWTGRPTPQPYYVDTAAIAATLPSLSTAGMPAIPDKADILPRVQRHEIAEQMTSKVTNAGYQEMTTQGAIINPTARNNYGSYLADTRGRAQMMLVSDLLTTPEKATLLSWLITHGLVYDSRAGAGVPIVADGGHFQFTHAPIAMALTYTGRSSLLPGVTPITGGNHLLQPFIWDAALIAELAPHDDLSKLWLGRRRTVTNIIGDAVYFTTDRTGGLGDPGKFSVKQLYMIRESDGVKSKTTDPQQDPDSIASGTGTFWVTIPSHSFSIGNGVTLLPLDPIEEGDPDWRVTNTPRISNPSNLTSYRDENRWTDDLLPLRAMGIGADIPEWEASDLYTARANRTDDPSVLYDYTTHHFDAFDQAMWTAHGPAVLGGKPLFLTRPKLQGGATVGEVLTFETATIAGQGPITSTYQLLRDGVDVPGETGPTYTVVAGDVGKVLAIRQTAAGALGTRSLKSLPSDPVVASYAINTVRFDGVNNRLNLESGYTGVPASTKVLLSFNIFVVGAWPSAGCVLSTNNDGGLRHQVELLASGAMQFRFRNASNVAVIQFNTVTGSFAADTWYTIAFAADTSTGVMQAYKRPSGGAWTALSAATTVLTAGELIDVSNRGRVGTRTGTGGTLLPEAYLGDLWYGPGQFLDLSVAGNRDRFLPNEIKGTNGGVPTGSYPEMWLSGPTAAWHENRGTGGGFTLTGPALTTAPSAPT